MRNLFKAFFIFILLFLLIGCSSPVNTPTATEPAPSEAPSAATLSSKDKFATAIAIDQATEAAKPTRLPSPTVNPALASAGGWWNDTVFYEIFVRSFYDSNGDGIGDFNGITKKLDYLQAVGIKGICSCQSTHPPPITAMM